MVGLEDVSLHDVPSRSVGLDGDAVGDELVDVGDAPCGECLGGVGAGRCGTVVQVAGVGAVAVAVPDGPVAVGEGLADLL